MKAAIIPAVMMPITPTGRSRPRKTGMPYKLSSATVPSGSVSGEG